MLKMLLGMTPGTPGTMLGTRFETMLKVTLSTTMLGMTLGKAKIETRWETMSHRDTTNTA